MGAFPIISKGEYLTIGHSGIEKRMIGPITIDRHGDASEVCIKQSHLTEYCSYWLRWRWYESDIVRLYDDIQRIRNSADWDAEPEDKIIKVTDIEFESRYIRYYKLQHYSNGFSRFYIWLHGKMPWAEANYPRFEGAAEDVIPLFVDFISQLHGVSRSEARRHHDRISIDMSQYCHL